MKTTFINDVRRVSRSQDSRNKQGFTLIELLIVIAIIAILSAILLPVFAQAREKARTSTCLSNVKQLSNAVLMYAQDYDDGVIAWTRGINAEDRSYSQLYWTNGVQPYVKNGGQNGATGVMNCPSWSLDTLMKGVKNLDCYSDPVKFTSRTLPYAGIYSHYGMAFGVQPEDLLNPANELGDGTQTYPYFMSAGSNWLMYDSSGRRPDLDYTRRLSEIVRPSENAMFGDGGTWVGFPTATTYRSTTIIGCEGAEMHTRGAVLVFFDGHAKWIARNPERYLMQRKDGAWVKRFFYWAE